MAIARMSAKPEPTSFDLNRTALIVVDMQNDFGSDGGMFERAGIDISPIKAIVPAVRGVIARARAASLPIIFTKQQHKPDLSDLGDITSPHFIKHKRLGVGTPMEAPDGRQSRILIENTWNTDIVEALRPEPHDIISPKHRFSAFFQTELETLLRRKNISTLVIVGATTSVCVDSTVRDATFRDFSCIVLSDCTAEPIGYNETRSNHEASLLTIQLLFGWVGESADFHAALNDARQYAPI